MAIYTRAGDGGESFLSGEKVSKKDERMEVLGALDELNSAIGLANSFLLHDDMQIRRIQEDILLAGAILSGGIGIEKASVEFSRRTQELEASIEQMEKELPMLENFIIPAGCKAASALHLARAIARRAERRIVAADLGLVKQHILPYFNRLSSYLFQRARLENLHCKVDDEIWKVGKEQ